MKSRRIVRQLLNFDGAAAAGPEVRCELSLATVLAPREQLRLETLPALRAESRLAGDRLTVAFYLPDWDYTDPERHEPARLTIPDDRLEAFAAGVQALVREAIRLGVVVPSPAPLGS